MNESKQAFSFETFRKIGVWDASQWSQPYPGCWNGAVNFRKYRVTVEEIIEPKEVLIERLVKLWQECDNIHNAGPLQAAAKEIGLNLDAITRGSKRKAK